MNQITKKLAELRLLVYPSRAVPQVFKVFLADGFAFLNFQIVQYDPVAIAPLGVVCDRIDGRKIRLLTSDGSEPSTPGEEIEAIELVGPGRVGSAPVNAINGKGSFSAEVERIERNEEGGFWYVYQFNKFKLLKQRQAALEASGAAESGGTNLPKVVSTLPYSWQL